jgi:uncharacterized protein
LNKEQILKEAHDFVLEQLGADSSGHDYWHAYRVSEMAGKIAHAESADIFVCKLTGLLHDIADEKLNASEETGQNKVIQWLEDHHVDELMVENIMEIIRTMSFKGGGNPPVRTLEGKIVQDADRLDAIGAIGIARTFAYSGSKGQLIYEPNILPREKLTKENYRKDKNTAVNHFYEKLLKLKDMMNTAYAKEIAEERHQFMNDFLGQFYKESNFTN